MNKVRILLLGSGSRLELRRRVARALKKRILDRPDLARADCSVAIMEDYDDLPGELFVDKWKRILNQFQPTHYFVIVCDGAKPSGWSEEIGTLWGSVGVRAFLERCKLFIEEGVEINEVFSGYLLQLVGTGTMGYATWRSKKQLTGLATWRLENLAIV